LSLASQINSIKETQQEFSTLNEPYVQVDSISRLKFYNYAPTTFVIAFTNLGNYPAKVLTMTTVFDIDSIPDYSIIKTPLKINFPKTVSLNQYVTKETPFGYAVTGTYPLGKRTKKYLKKPDSFIFIYGVMKYQNVITQEIKYYEFALKIYTGLPGFQFDYLWNENVK
jgi:hypothetical protein